MQKVNFLLFSSSRVDLFVKSRIAGIFHWFSGTPTCAWHSGQRNFPSCWVARACLFKHSQQNVWRQVIVLGSVKVSKQIEHVTCPLRFLKRDSIVKQIVKDAPSVFANHIREESHHPLLVVFGKIHTLAIPFGRTTKHFRPPSCLLYTNRSRWH